MDTNLAESRNAYLARSDTILARRSLSSELRALLVMARKEWTIFTRYPSWIIAFIIWPIIFPLGAIFTARALSGPDHAALPAFTALAGTSDYIAFIIVGLTIYMWINITLWDVGFQLRNEQMRGTLESNWLCPTWRFSILLGPSMTKLATSMIFLVLTVVEYQLIFGVGLIQGNLALILLIMLLTIPSVYGIGIAFGSLVIRFKEADAMVFLVRGVFMIFTGSAYPLEVLPAWMKTVAAYLPLTYTIRSIRSVSLAGKSFDQILPDLQMLAVFAVVMPIAGYTIFQFTERRARRTGALGQY